jgi:WD40 repeat protein
MNQTHSAIVLWLLLTALSLSAHPAVAQTPIPIASINRSDTIDFEQEVLPILRRSCLACHSNSDANGSLVLETPATILKGGDSGPAVVAENGVDSLLLKLAAHLMEPLMPPPDNDVGARTLTTQELGLLKAWIDQGATGTVQGVISPENWRPLPHGVNPIYSTAVSRDGQFAAAGRANQIYIYHVPSGQLVTKLNDPALLEESTDPRPGIAHRDLVQSLSFNRAGDMLASGGFRTIKLWRRPSDVRHLELTTPDAITAVAASPDGTFLATASTDNVIRLWDRETGTASLTLEGHTAAVTALSFLPDRSRLASASADRTIRFWNLDDGSPAGRVDTSSEISGLTLLANSTRMASAHTDNFARYWIVPPGPPQILTQVSDNATVVAVSPDRQFYATANGTGVVRVVDVDCGQLLDVSWQAHAGTVSALSFSAAGGRLASAGADGVVRVWNIESGEPVLLGPAIETTTAAAATTMTAEAAEPATGAGADPSVLALKSGLRGTLGQVTAVALRADGKEITAGMADGEVTVWNLEAAAPRSLAALPGDNPTPDPAVPVAATTDPKAEETPTPLPLSLNGTPANVAAVSPDGKLLAVSGTVENRPTILVRDLATGELKFSLPGHFDAITSLVFAADNRRLMSGSVDKTARVWDLADAKFPEVFSFGGHAAAVTGVAFNSNGTQAATCAADKSVQLWNTITGEVLQSFEGHTAAVVGIAMTPNNAQVITASADRTIRIWTAADGKVVRTITAPAPITRLVVSRDGTRIGVSQPDNSILLYNPADGALLQSLKGHATAVMAVAFAADGTRIVSADIERAIVWESISGRLLEILPIEHGISTAVYGPTPNEVVLARADTGIDLHTLRFKVALGDVDQVVTRTAYLADGSVIASSLDGSLRRFTPANGNQVFASAHGAPVNDFALSPNGQLLASAGENMTVRLWTASNGAAQPNSELAGFTGAVQHVEFSSDSTRLVASGAVANEVHVFDVATRTLEQTFTEHTKAVTGLACAGSGFPIVISVAADQGVRQWPLLLRRRISGHTKPLTSIAALPETLDALPGSIPQAVTGSLDGTVRQWNLRTGALIRNMNHGAPVTDVAVRSDGLKFASVGENNTARLWNAANGASVAILKGDVRTLNKLARDEQELALITAKVASTDTELKVAQARVPVQAATAKTAADALTAATTAVTAADAVLKTATATKAAAEQKAVQAAAAAQSATLKTLAAARVSAQTQAAAARAVEKAARAKATAATDTQNTTLATASTATQAASVAAAAKSKSAADAATLADTASRTAATAATTTATAAIATGKPFTDALTALRAAKVVQNTASQTSAVAASEVKKAAAAVPIVQAELKTAQERSAVLTAQAEASKQAVAAAEQPLRSVAFSPDTRLLATGGDYMAVHTWSAETGQAMASFKSHVATVGAVTFVGNSELLSGSADKDAFVWDAEPGWTLERTIGSIDDATVLADRVMALDFNTDGSLLVAGGGVPSRFGEVKIFSTADGALVRALSEPHTDGVLGVAFSPDGSKIATCGADKYVKVFVTATGAMVRPFEGHTDYVLDVAWRGDSRSLASCGADNTIRVWDVNTGELSRVIPGFEKQVTDVRFIGDSINTVSSSGDRTVRMHRTDNGQVLRTFAGGTDFMYCVDSTPDSRYVIAGGFDSVLRIWNGVNGAVLYELSPESPPGESVAAEGQ